MDDVTIFTMAARGATLDDLRRADGKAELVGGEIVRMTPASRLHAFISGEIFASLRAYAKRSGRGRAVGDNAGFVVNLPHRRSFSPDAGYYFGALADDLAEGAPVFAVEIRSKEDYGPAAETRLAMKRADYFAAGTRIVWDVNPRHGLVHVYRAVAPEDPTTYARGDIADAEPALPGWRMPVDDLFPPGVT